MAGSNSRATLVTRPTVMPRNSTGAPGLSPRTEPSKKDQERDLLGELRLRQRALVRVQRETGAGIRDLAAASAEGVSNSMPPMISDCSEPTWTSIPEAPVETLIPLAFQNRLVVRTRSLYGALTKIEMSRLRSSGAKLVVQHLADVEATVEDRGATADRAQARGGQRYSPTGHVGVDRRRLLQAGERSRRRTFARGKADIGPGQQRAEPRYAAYADPRLDDPEGGSLAQVRFGAGNHLGGDDDVLEVRCDRDRPRGADLDVEVAQLGLARLQPLGGLRRSA